MAFDAYDRSLALLRALVPVLDRLTSADPKLADQLRRAAQSTLLNIAEGNRRSGRDRLHHFRIALGSAAEVGAALDAACVLCRIAEAEYAAAAELVDRVRAMTYRLATR